MKKRVSHWFLLSVVAVIFAVACKKEANLSHPAGHSPVPENAATSSVGNKYSVTTEQTVVTDADAIQAHFDRGTAGEFVGGGIKIVWRRVPALQGQPDRGAIVISSGRTEGMVIYPELIYDLAKRGYTVYILDHRGQGFSGRLLEDRQRSHVVQFDDYVADLETFVNTIVKPANHAKRYLLAHSMGGGIATLYIEKNHEDFDAAVLITPMHEPRLPLSSSALCKANEAIPDGKLDGYGLKQGPYDPPPFAENDLTHSKIRFERLHASYRAVNDRDQVDPTIGGPTHRWIRQACRAATRAVEKAAEVRTPVLILQASHDTAVGNAAQDEFCKRVNAAKNTDVHEKLVKCERYVAEHAFHALHLEADPFRIPALTKIFDFLDQH